MTWPIEIRDRQTQRRARPVQGDAGQPEDEARDPSNIQPIMAGHGQDDGGDHWHHGNEQAGGGAVQANFGVTQQHPRTDDLNGGIEEQDPPIRQQRP